MAEPVAYAIGLKPREFEEMQPGEFLLMLEAVNRQRREEDYRTAYFLSFVIAPYLKKDSKLTLEDIVDPLWMTEEELKAKKEEKARQEKEHDRAVLEQEFGWALRRE